MTPETIAEIRNALQIIKGNTQFIEMTSSEGHTILKCAATVAQVDRIVKLLEEKC